MKPFLLALVLLLPFTAAYCAPSFADAPADTRLGALKDLNGYFPFTPAESKEAWETRAAGLRRQLLLATGLWPMPTRTPPQAAVYGRVDREGYSVWKVTLQSYPGHYVTGNLYRPTGRSGRLPAVLSPHGHWAEGRFFDAGLKKTQSDIKAGAERFEVGGRYPLQARCVQLARMGCAVFHYDMLGYADSLQLEHRPGTRQAMNTTENWGYFSPQAELRLETMMGLQTYNSVRALDWLSSLPEVDPQRIGVTGASGGGTQTFILCAIDPRPAAAFPAVMVSTAMQGGCTCENSSYLRVGTGNVEIAALIAPRPLGMTAADDWTKELATKGLPQLQAHYRMLGVPDLVSATLLLQFPHNYNYVSRAAMYAFMNRHLKLGQKEPIVEADFKPLSRAEMSVWDADHPRPPHGDDYERSLLKCITTDNDRQMAALVPHDAASVARYREVIGGAVDTLIGRRVPSAEAAARLRIERDPQWATDRLLHDPATGERVHALELLPEHWNRRLVIWVSESNSISSWWRWGAQEATVVQRLDKTGNGVLAIEVFGRPLRQGEKSFKNPLNASGQNDWARYAGYTYGYNYPLFAQRVHDILTAIGYARHVLKAEKVYLLGLGDAGRLVAAACAQAGDAVDRAAIDTAGFRFARLTAIDDADFLPGGAKYLDLPGMLALCAPHEMWLAGEGPEAPAVVTAAYRASGHPQALTLSPGVSHDRGAAALDWLLR